MNKVYYRLYEPKDIIQIIELGVALQEELTGKKLEIQDNYLKSSSTFFQSGIENKNYLCAIAEIDGRIISLGGICTYNTPPVPPQIQGKVGFLTNFYTHPEFRRKGHSKRVLKLLIDQSRALKLTRLHMGTTDKGIGLYTQAGFKESNYKQLVLSLSH